jgi:hypothetical protein
MDPDSDYIDEYGYSQNPNSDDEGLAWGDDDDDSDSEFDERDFFDEPSEDPFELPEQEFVTGFQQMEHVSRAGQTVGRTRLERSVLQSKESIKELYLAKLSIELDRYFSDNLVATYKQFVQDSVPRYWLKNGPALSAALFMFDRAGQKLEKTLLDSTASESGIDPVSLYRYYRLVVNSKK